jgi:hypothetical protein
MVMPFGGEEFVHAGDDGGGTRSMLREILQPDRLGRAGVGGGERGSGR